MKSTDLPHLLVSGRTTREDYTSRGAGGSTALPPRRSGALETPSRSSSRKSYSPTIAGTTPT